MKAQLSLEMLVYLALAFVSVGIILGVAREWYSLFQYSSGQYLMYQLAQRINYALLSGATLVAYPGLCDQNFSGGYMETMYGNFSMVMQVNKSALCG